MNLSGQVMYQYMISIVRTRAHFTTGPPAIGPSHDLPATPRFATTEPSSLKNNDH